MSHKITIRTSMEGHETLVDGKVFGHIDENGWFPDIGLGSLPFFRLTPENLHSIANYTEGHIALCKSMKKAKDQ